MPLVVCAKCAKIPEKDLVDLPKVPRLCPKCGISMYFIENPKPKSVRLEEEALARKRARRAARKQRRRELLLKEAESKKAEVKEKKENKPDLKDMKVGQLRQLAKQLKVANWWTIQKDKLIAAIKKANK